MFGRKQKKEEQHRQEVVQDVLKVLSVEIDHGSISIDEVLSDGNAIILQNVSVPLYNVVTHRVSRYGGARVMKGVYAGGSSSHSVQDMEVVDQGKFVASTEGIFFYGSRNTVEAPVRRILRMEWSREYGLHVHMSGRQHPVAFGFAYPEFICVKLTTIYNNIDDWIPLQTTRYGPKILNATRFPILHEAKHNKDLLEQLRLSIDSQDS